MRGRIVAALICVLGLSGCSMFPRWLHPGNLWKLNGHEPGGRDTMYFSIPDPPPRHSTVPQAAELDSDEDVDSPRPVGE